MVELHNGKETNFDYPLVIITEHLGEFENNNEFETAPYDEETNFSMRNSLGKQCIELLNIDESK